MSVECKICHRIFDKQITNKHLKSHNITTHQYKEMYGVDSLSSAEYRLSLSRERTGSKNKMYGKSHTEETKKLISSKNKGKAASNKNIAMPEEQKLKLKEKAVERNRNWRISGNHPLLGRELSEETKEKIREKRKDQKITSEQVQKAIQTKISKGYDLAFFKGKTHTEESKLKIKERALINFKIRMDQTDSLVKNKITEYGFELCNDIRDNFLQLKCNPCSGITVRTRQVFYESKINSKICEKCFPREKYQNKAELEILEYIRNLLPGIEVISGDRIQINPYELDIFIPELKLAIEYNGLYHHSELSSGRGRDYHREKYEKSKSKGINLITIFEDEYINKKDIVLSRIHNALNKPNVVLYGRNCEVKEISSRDLNKFLVENHLQGSGRSTIRLGLFHNNELVGVMSFIQSNISRRLKSWEIDRFAIKKYYSIKGGASKLFKYAIKTYNFDKIISYSDLRWGYGSVYEKFGFKLDSVTSPGYWYINGTGKRYHRFTLRKNKNDIQELSEWENRKIQGWDRVWDCGHSKWMWEK